MMAILFKAEERTAGTRGELNEAAAARKNSRSRLRNKAKQSDKHFRK